MQLKIAFKVTNFPERSKLELFLTCMKNKTSDSVKMSCDMNNFNWNLRQSLVICYSSSRKVWKSLEEVWTETWIKYFLAKQKIVKAKWENFWSNSYCIIQRTVSICTCCFCGGDLWGTNGFLIKFHEKLCATERKVLKRFWAWKFLIGLEFY